MCAGLAAMRAAAGVAHRRYDSAASTNVRMWGGSRGGWRSRGGLPGRGRGVRHRQPPGRRPVHRARRELASYAGMAGDDSTATRFASSYDEAATAAVEAVGELTFALASLGHLAAASLHNHAWAETVSGPRPRGPGRRGPTGPAADVARRRAVIPARLGAPRAPASSRASSGRRPTPGRLRAAARRWRSAAVSVGLLAAHCSSAVAALGNGGSPRSRSPSRPPRTCKADRGARRPPHRPRLRLRRVRRAGRHKRDEMLARPARGAGLGARHRRGRLRRDHLLHRRQRRARRQPPGAARVRCLGPGARHPRVARCPEPRHRHRPPPDRHRPDSGDSRASPPPGGWR